MRTRNRYLVGAVILLLGVGLVGASFVQPDECDQAVAISVTELSEPNGTVTEAGNLSEPVQLALQTAIEEDRPGFVEPGQYGTDIDNSTVQFEGQYYWVTTDDVEKCGGGRDDLFLLVGFWVAVIGMTVLALVGLADFGKDYFPTEDDVR
ncbi:hypothetical protein [Haloarchaeobius sp. TZWWS8]|uniref:hypothetical protein n=1 Tax=Haloarchaeobius sp. TZWWS8 TaxID=3446121 RepID=UPI003EC0A125